MTGQTRTERLLETTANVGTFALLVLAPLAMGGRHPVGRFVFVALICMLALAWIWGRFISRRHDWHLTGLEWVLFGVIGAILLQLAPLPESWLAVVSPAVAERLPLWNASGSANLGLGTWSSISLHPDATRSGLAMFVAYALLFLVVAQRMTDSHAVRRTVRIVATAAMLMAAVGLVQFLTGTDKFLWVYAHPTRLASGVVKGTFANQNHMAHMLALGIGPLIWWLSCVKLGPSADDDRKRRGVQLKSAVAQWQSMALGTGLGLVLLAGLLTFSRAGVLAMVLATVVAGAVLAWTKTLSRRGWAVGGLVALTLAVAIALHGYDQLATRAASLVGAQSLGELSAGRQMVWSAVEKSIGEFPVIGSGVGTHRDVYPMFLDQYAAVEFTHAESGYLQVLEELGVVGLSLLLIVVGVVGNWCRLALLHAPDRQTRVLAGAVTASLVVSALHSFVDFVWYIPACMTITVVLAACAWRLSLLGADHVPHSERVRLPRPMLLAGSLGTSIVAMVIITLNLGPARAAQDWEQFLRLADRYPSAEWPNAEWPNAEWPNAEWLGSEWSGNPSQAEQPTSLAAENKSLSQELPQRASRNTQQDTQQDTQQIASQTNIDRMITHVTRVLNANPRNARAHSRLAALCLQKFNIQQRNAANAMSLTEIRDAAIASEFPSLKAQNQWLDRAVAENRHLLDTAFQHARQSVRLAPLQGEPYVYLAQLGFLAGHGQRAKWAYLDQALRVRPYNDDVLMAAGGEYALEGDLRQATVYWRHVFQRSPVYQTQIIAMFAPQVSADAFCKTFQPDAAGAKMLFSYYRKIGLVPQAKVAGRYYVAQLNVLADQSSNGLEADQWLAAAVVQDYLGDDSAVLGSLRQALAQAPTRYVVHQKLARQLLRQRYYQEAREQLQWCLRRKPSDRTLQRDLQIATRMDMAPTLR